MKRHAEPYAWGPPYTQRTAHGPTATRPTLGTRPGTDRPAEARLPPRRYTAVGRWAAADDAEGVGPAAHGRNDCDIDAAAGRRHHIVRRESSTSENDAVSRSGRGHLPWLLVVGRDVMPSRDRRCIALREIGRLVVLSSTEDALVLMRSISIDLLVLDADGEGHWDAKGLDFVRTVRTDPRLRHIPIMILSQHAAVRDAAINAGAKACDGTRVNAQDLIERAQDALTR